MSHAHEILKALDEELHSPVDLTLYGRAALTLGFADPPPEYGFSLDVDAVLWVGQAEALASGTDFWEAVEAVNLRLAGRGLYISHFFEETQVVLLPEWRETRVPLAGNWKHLILHRLSDTDLFLSKLMRDDPIDMADARFILERAGLNDEKVFDAIRRARVPDVIEIREQFSVCSARFLKNHPP